jgi:hypothetical protein
MAEMGKEINLEDYAAILAITEDGAIEGAIDPDTPPCDGQYLFEVIIWNLANSNVLSAMVENYVANLEDRENKYDH